MFLCLEVHFQSFTCINRLDYANGENLTYEKWTAKILDRKDQVLKTKIVPLVKVLWKNYSYEEAT